MVNMTTTTAQGSSALLTDHYELTMLRAALADGTAHHQARLRGVRPPAAATGAGTASSPASAASSRPSRRFTFDDDAGRLAPRARASSTSAPPTTCAAYRFTGNVDAYREGDIYFPNSPVLTVTGTFAECVDPRDAHPVDPQPRHRDRLGRGPHGQRRQRPHPGRDGLAPHQRARRRRRRPRRLHRRVRRHHQPARPGSPTACRRGAPPPTRSPSAHTDEPTAFASQVATLGAGTTLLVDTYDTTQGIRNAVAAAGADLGGIRIDSGDLADEAHARPAPCSTRSARRPHDDRRHLRPGRARHRRARRRADRHVRRGHQARRRLGPPDRGDGLQARRRRRPGRARTPRCGRSPRRPPARAASAAARSPTAASTTPGTPPRRSSSSGTCPVRPRPGLGRALQVAVIRDGQVVHRPTLDEIRAHHRGAKAELPPARPRPRARHPAPRRRPHRHRQPDRSSEHEERTDRRRRAERLLRGRHAGRHRGSGRRRPHQRLPRATR